MQTFHTEYYVLVLGLERERCFIDVLTSGLLWASLSHCILCGLVLGFEREGFIVVLTSALLWASLSHRILCGLVLGLQIEEFY